jgi:UDP-GlcNAc:undecaprenyl-phosphate GlcNAc-1-phosphate transferase
MPTLDFLGTCRNARFVGIPPAQTSSRVRGRVFNLSGTGPLPTPILAAILPLAVAFLTTFLLVPPVRRFATEWRLGDKPNGRKLHAHSIPHLGGIAIFGGFFLAMLVLLATPFGMPQAARVLALLPGLLILFGLGLVDDLRGLRAGVKLTYQLLGAVCVVAMGAGLRAGGGVDVALLPLVGLSVLWYVGVCNSVNLIDGLDGLAAGTSAIAAAAYLVIGVVVGDAAVVLVAMSLIGALLAFLRYNFHPARIFMGDTGSMFIGFTLAFLACLLAQRVGFWPALLGSVAILGVPILDTVTAILRRLAARQHIFTADGEHTHHKLIQIGFSHRSSVLLLYVVAAMFACIGSGILLGNTGLFVWAFGLGTVVTVSVTLLARRTRPRTLSQRTVEQPVAVPQPVVTQEAGVVAGRVVPVARPAERQPQDAEVLAGVPPAAGGRP